MPIGVDRFTMDYTIGRIAADGSVHCTAVAEVPLFTLAPSSPTVVYQGIRFGTSFQILPVRENDHSRRTFGA